MALSGLHVLCASAGRSGALSEQALMKEFQWSETLATAGTTSQAARGSVEVGLLVFRVRSSSDAWVAVGSAPVANQAVSSDRQSARMFVAAGVDYDIYVKGGDKLAWVAA